jgi:hypothetical protein
LSKHILSKSSYIRGLQCLKSLYFYKFHYKDRDPISAEQQARFTRGHQFGKLAHMLFPSGIDASPDKPYNYEPSIKLTQELILKQTAVIYEAAFVHNDVLAAVDILVKREGKLSAYEVKSSTRISETYLNDAALQYYLITGAGYELDDFYITHLKPEYKDGGTDNVQLLFTHESVKEYCLYRLPYVQEHIEEAKNIITKKRMPFISQGDQCNTPYPCDFKNLCNKSNAFAEGSLFSLG